MKPKSSASLLKAVATNDDGRTDTPLLDGEALKPGTYELRFHAGDYHRRNGAPQTHPPFLDIVPVRLPKGTTSVLLKITNNLGNWGFVFRITDLQGRPLTNLKFGLSPG